MNTILNITRKTLLNEVAGISTIVREWAKILKKEVETQNRAYKEEELKKIAGEPEDEKSDPFYWEDEFSKGKGSKGQPRSYMKEDRGRSKSVYYKRRYKDEPQGYEGGYKYSSYTPKTYITPLQEVIVFGKKYPEQYKKFSVDRWVFKNSDRIEYDHWHSGYGTDGDYVVYFNVPIEGLSEGAFIHEIKHAYDDWNRMRHGGKAIRDTWEIKNIYTKDFEKLILGGSRYYPQLGPLIRYFYLGSKLETPAYLENEHDSGFLVNYEDVANKMKNFDTQNFFDKRGNPAKGLEDEFQDLKELDIPIFKKYKNVTDFLNWVKKYFNKRGDDIYRRVVKMKYVHGKPMSSSSKFEPMKPETYSVSKKEVKPTPENEFGEGESMGDWKYSKERGWYYAGDDDIPF